MSLLAPLSIRRHLTLLVLAIMLPLLALNTYVVYRQARRAEQDSREDIQRLAHLAAADATRLVANIRTVLEHFSRQDWGTLSADPARCNTLFSHIAAADPSVMRESLVRLRDARVVCSSEPARPSQNIYPGPRAWLDSLSHARDTRISPAYFDDRTRHWMVDFGYRVPDVASAALIWSVDLAVTPSLHYRGRLAQELLPAGSTDTLIDGAGRVLARWPYSNWIGRRAPDAEVVGRVLNGGGEGTVIAAGIDGHQRLYGFAPVRGTDWSAYVGIPTDVAILPQQLYLWHSLLLGLGVTLVVALLATYFSRRIARPIEQLGSAANAATGGRLETRVRPSGLAEVRQVAERFNSLLSARQRAENELAEEKRRAEITLHSIGDAVVRVDREHRITYLNPAAEHLTGWSLTEAIGQPLFDVVVLVHEATHEAIRGSVEDALQRGARTDIGHDTLLIARDGRQYDVADSIAPLIDPERGVVGAVLAFHDITETRELERRLSWQARHDVLTGLVNRAELERQLVEIIDEAKLKDTRHALLYVDLDQFKAVNDTAGHLAGDELLRRLAEMLKTTTRPGQTLARIGGDEFCVLVRNASLEAAERIADRIRTSVQDFRFVWEGQTFGVGASIGLVAINGLVGSLEEVMNAADIACYAAKEQGRNRVHVFVPEDETVRERLEEPEWVRRIGKAFEEQRFRLYQQTISPIAPGSSDPVLHEILVRMFDEKGNVLPPTAFLPAAHRYNLLTTLDRWVIATAFACIGASRAKPHCNINISGHSISDDRFLQFVLDQFEANDVDARRICFEVTESAAVVNLNRATHFMNELRAKGARFALDDFGIGISSLAYLRTLPVDILKIDGRFVRNIDRDHIDHAMVEAIIRVGRVMHLKTVAEFVENERTQTYVQALGVDYAQGYAVSEPAPLELILDVDSCDPSEASRRGSR